MRCRDAEVLSLFSALINKLKQRMESEVPQIFEAVFECTLQMITKNFEVGAMPMFMWQLLRPVLSARKSV